MTGRKYSNIRGMLIIGRRRRRAFDSMVLFSEITCHPHTSILVMSGELATGVDRYTLSVWKQFSETGTESCYKSLIYQTQHLELNLYGQPVKLTKNWGDMFILSYIS